MQWLIVTSIWIMGNWSSIKLITKTETTGTEEKLGRMVLYAALFNYMMIGVVLILAFVH